MRDKIAKVPGLRDVNTDLYITNPQMTIEIDREKAAVYGITIDQIRQEMFNAFGTRQVATIYTPSNDYQVILETKPEFQADPSSLSKIFLKTNGGGAVASPWHTAAPGTGITGNGIPSGVDPAVGGDQAGAVGRPAAGQPPGPAAGGDDLVQSGARLFARRRRSTRSRRSSASPTCRRRSSTGFQGTAQVFQESLKGQGILVLAAIFAAYVVLGILYESFIHPITIISGLPSAGIGALLTLMLFKMDLSVIAMIGIVMLVGIVKKNAIMMIDFALERRRVGIERRGGDPRSLPAALPADHDDDLRRDLRRAADRARPGAGAELRQPLGVAVVGGLVPVAAADALHHAGRSTSISTASTACSSAGSSRSSRRWPSRRTKPAVAAE